MDYCAESMVLMGAFAAAIASIGCWHRILLCCGPSLARRDAFFDRTVSVLVASGFLLHPVLSARLLRLYDSRMFGDQVVLTADST